MRANLAGPLNCKNLKKNKKTLSKHWAPWRLLTPDEGLYCNLLPTNISLIFLFQKLKVIVKDVKTIYKKNIAGQVLNYNSKEMIEKQLKTTTSD